MTKRRKAFLAGLLLVPVLTPRVMAQVALPPAASPFAPLAGAGADALGAAPAAAAPVAAAPAAAGGGRTIWSFFGISKENCAACRAALCQSQLGMLLNNATKPLGAFTGGLTPSICPPVPPGAGSPASGGPGGAQSVASKIAKDTAEAKARVAAVEYLGTVDCHYWPDAEAALIQSLRTDRNECVRFAAARVMGSGCCCTKNTMAALLIVVTGDDKDDNPAETSERVRAAAFISLQNCQCRYTAPPPHAPERPEPIRLEQPETADSRPRAAATADGAVVLSSYYTKQMRDMPLAEVLDQVRLVLAKSSDIPMGRRGLPTGRKDVLDALVRSATRPDTGSPGLVAMRRDDAVVPSGAAGTNSSADDRPCTIPPPTPFRRVAPAPGPAPPSLPAPRPPVAPPAALVPRTTSRNDPLVAPVASKTTAPPDGLTRQAAPSARDHTLLGVLLSSNRSQTDAQ